MAGTVALIHVLLLRYTCIFAGGFPIEEWVVGSAVALGGEFVGVMERSLYALISAYVDGGWRWAGEAVMRSKEWIGL